MLVFDVLLTACGEEKKEEQAAEQPAAEQPAAEQPAAEAAPAATPEDVLLLREIRDSLKSPSA